MASWIEDEPLIVHYRSSPVRTSARACVRSYGSARADRTDSTDATRSHPPAHGCQSNLCHATTDDLFPMHQYLYEWLGRDAGADAAALRRRPLIGDGGNATGATLEPVRPLPGATEAAHLYFPDPWVAPFTDALRGAWVCRPVEGRRMRAGSAAAVEPRRHPSTPGPDASIGERPE